MEYGLAKMVLGSNAFVSISEDKYLSIKHATFCLFECLYTEEKFDLLVENYLEFETTLLESTVHDMILKGQDYRSSNLERGLFNRRLANLLSAGRIYTDHMKQHVDRIFADRPNDAFDINAEFSKQYDDRFGYRCMEALRNHVQHCGFPVHILSFQHSRVDRQKKNLLRYAITPYLRPKDLRADDSFKKETLKEIESMGDEIDLKFLVRDYMEGFSIVHSDLRKKIHQKCTEWESVLNEAIELYKANNPEENTIGLSAVIRKEAGLYKDDISLFLDFIELRKYFEKKNNALINLTLRFATNEIIEKRKI